MRLLVALLVGAYVSDASDAFSRQKRVAVKTWSGTRSDDACSTWLVTHIRTSLKNSEELRETLMHPVHKPEECKGDDPHAFVFLKEPEAIDIASSLITRARGSDTGSGSVLAFKMRLRDAAWVLYTYLPPKTKDAAGLFQTEMKRGQSGDYGSFCDPIAPSIAFSSDEATFYVTHEHGRRKEFNYLLPFVTFLHRMVLCDVTTMHKPEKKEPLPRMTLEAYEGKYTQAGTGLGELPGVLRLAALIKEKTRFAAESGVAKRQAPSVHSVVNAPPSVHDDALGKLGERGLDSDLDSLPREDVPAVVPAVVPETPKDDIIAEQGTLQSQTSRLTRVASNVLKTWGMMRTAGIDAIDAVATVAMLADYADLVQQICYHLDAMDSSSRRVDEMIEATLDSTYVYVLKDKPELQAAE